MSVIQKQNRISAAGLMIALFAFLAPLEGFLTTSVGSVLKFYTIGVILFMIGEVFFRGGIRKFTVIIPLLLFMASLSLSVLWTDHVSRGIDALAAIALQVLLICMITQVKFGEKDKRLIVYAYIISAVILSVLVFINRNNMDDEARATVSTGSGVLDPNNVAALIVMGFALILNMPAEKLPAKISRYVLLTVTVIAVLLTASRGGFLGMAVVVFFYLVTQRKLKRAIVFIIGIGIVALIIYLLSRYTGINFISALLNRFTTDSTGSNRLGLWKGAVEAILNKPIFGYGLGESPYIVAQFSMELLGSHNTYLTLWLEGGIFALLFLLGFVAYLFFKIDKNSRFAISAYAMLAGGLVLSFFIDTYNKKILWLPILLCVMAVTSPKIKDSLYSRHAYGDND